MLEFSKREQKQFFIMVAAAIILSVAFIVFILLPKTAGSYTEFYFVQPMPATAAIDETVSFSFVVRNMEGEQASYSYGLFLDGELESEGSLLLENNQLSGVETEVKFAASGRHEIEVRLKKPLEAELIISKWIEVNE